MMTRSLSGIGSRLPPEPENFVNGRVKVGQTAAENVATLGWKNCRIGVRQQPGSRACHRAGGGPDALARNGQMHTV